MKCTLAEYDSLPGWDIMHSFPRMWLGIRSRYQIVKKVNGELRRLDTLIHLASLTFNQKQMSMHDVGQTFRDLPLLDTVRLEKAVRTSGDSGSAYVGAATYDPRDSSYFEISHFKPSRRDTAGLRNGSEYLLFTNRRTWPVDRLHYDSAYYGGSNTGFGAIDVRRPCVTLKGMGRMMSDSIIVEKVLDTSWHRTVASFQEVPLDWVEPGWGAMYRITPQRSGISTLGTASNNSVHGENLSTSAAAHDRILVYEKDSAVYLRTMDSAGVWSGEHLISAPADTQTIGTTIRHRVANNISPAFATVRTNNAPASCMVVWEREYLSPTNKHIRSVESVCLSWIPSRTLFDSIGSWSAPRLQLAPPDSFPQSSMVRAPAVVGIGGGYVVAYGAPDYMIEVRAVRDNMQQLFQDVSWPIHVNIALSSDSTTKAEFPTLAYAQNYAAMYLDSGLLSESDSLATGAARVDTIGAWAGAPNWFASVDDDEYPSLAPDTLGGGTNPRYHAMHRVHLAYQQGTRQNTNTRIYYHIIGVNFDEGSPAVRLPRLWIAAGEHVTTWLYGCNFLHPSIATDLTRTGIAFEWQLPDQTDITLRFRNDFPGVVKGNEWLSPAYTWGKTDVQYLRPSLTEFPSRPKDTLPGVNYFGGLTWYKATSGDRSNKQLLYRFGKFNTDTIPDGHDPSLLLVPYRGDSLAFASTGVFYRGSNGTKFTAPHPIVATAWYYPGFLENSPLYPHPAFTAAGAGGIHPVVTMIWIQNIVSANYAYLCSVGGKIPFGTGLILANTPPVLTAPPPCIQTWYDPVFPPGIFPAQLNGQWIKTDSTFAMKLSQARTPVFRVDSCLIPVVRRNIGNDSLVAWLNTQPSDTALSMPANIISTIQLVRASDDKVLWQGDTVSARRVGDSSFDEVLLVPLDSATPGTNVYIRIALKLTAHLQYQDYHEVHFESENEGSSIVYKTAQPLRQVSTNVAGRLAVNVVPNPLGGGPGEIRIVLPHAGTATITVTDLLGHRVAALSPIIANQPGEYRLPFDIVTLPNGLYLVSVQQGIKTGRTQIVIVR